MESSEGSSPRIQLVPIASTQYHDQIPSGTIKARNYKFGIVGAGSAGLFTRLIFDHLKEVYGLDVEYEILEANDNKGLTTSMILQKNLIRNCVYPSYKIDDPIDKPGVLLASYTWSQEAQCIGTLINNKSSDGETELKVLLIDNLTQLHSSSKAEYDEVRQIIAKIYESHFAYDWYADPGTTGAFAYPRHIGEASSAHHAWVVGALESAVRGGYQFLYHQSKRNATVNKVLQAYNHNKVRAPYRPVLVEFNRTEDAIPLYAESSDGTQDVCAVGEWLRQGVLAESIRLKQGSDRLVPAKVKAEEGTEFLTVPATV